jgi:lysophospholipid acyltransferase (LPLAT)-like uncharacterized protein
MSAKEILMLRIVPWFAASLIRMIHALLQPETVGADSLRSLWREGGNVILALWHDQLLLMVRSYRGPGAVAMISASKDGEMIARVLAHFGVEAVRGSSSRGGKAALKMMIEAGRKPVDFVITPDGPRGPRHTLKDGVLHLAAATHRPIVPIAFACSRGRRFASWDRFLLPYPWGRGVFHLGEPLYYDKNEALADFRARVEAALESNSRAACDYLRRYDLSAV